VNFYSFHIGDYAAHTRHLSLLEDLAYRRMLDLYYTSEKALPDDPEKVARLIGMRDHIREVSDVLSDFFLKSEDGHRNRRADAEIAQYQAKADRAKQANNARWHREKSETDLKSDVRSDLISESDQIPTKNQEPLTKNQVNYSLSDDKESPLVEKIASDDPTEPGQGDRKRLPACPHKQILQTFSEALPELPQPDPKLWAGARAEHLQARWREVCVREKFDSSALGVEYFRRLFVYCRESKFLMGKAQSPPGRRPFVMELDWLVRPNNFVKVIEGKYTDA
jgi:uncharacterized protein YdaU (DUF1376 family)